MDREDRIEQLVRRFTPIVAIEDIAADVLVNREIQTYFKSHPKVLP